LTTNEKAAERETVVLSCRVNTRFAELVRKFCSMDSHLNPGDLLRDSLREKIERDAPELLKQLFKEEKQK
jgi:hypothetical protein